MSPRHTITIALCLLGLSALVTPLAASDPGPADTRVTPIAKDTTLWTRVAGAIAGQPRVPDDSPTRFTDDLYAVGFRNATNGFAGGAACDDPAGDPATCPRHPVMYRYGDSDGHGARWQLDASFPSGGAGFVGAIAYIPNSGRFLAVGGTGNYPKREPAAGEPDPAKLARAWLFEDGAWRELGDLPAGMRGMTALDFTATPAPLQEYGVAGALGQLWIWQNGRFTEKVDKDSAALKPPRPSTNGTSTDPATPADFQFRVRDVRAQSDPEGRPLALGRFLGVTAGCCSSSPTARAVVLSEDKDHWSVASLPSTANGGDPRRVSGYAVAGGFNFDARVGAFADPTLSKFLTNTDGTEGPSEPPSWLGEDRSAPPLAGDMRLVSGDGRGGYAQNHVAFDWYVGVDRATGHGIAFDTASKDPDAPVDTTAATTGQPVTDADRIQAYPQSIRLLDLKTYGLNAVRMNGDETSGVGWAVGDRGAIVQLGESAPGAGIEPPPADVGAIEEASLQVSGPYDAFRPLVQGAASGGVPALATRPLQRLAQPGPVAAGSADPAGPFAGVKQIVMSRDGDEGWAVGGDNGLALYHYESGHWSRCDPIGAPPLVEPDPHCAALGDLAGRGLRLYAAARVPFENDGDPGNDDELEIVAGGDYELKTDLRREVMVRYHDGAWRPEDPAAAQALDGDHIDPTTEFPSHVQSIAFAAPDDGWAISTAQDNFRNPAPIYHYDGHRWIDCFAAEAANDLASCGDQDKRLPQVHDRSDPVRQDVLRLQAVGKRIYLSGARIVSTETQATGSRHSTSRPLILHREAGGQWTAADGGYDPGRDETAGQQGAVNALAVARTPDGGYQGWAVGFFGGTGSSNDTILNNPTGMHVLPDARLLRLAPGAKGWEAWDKPDVSSAYLSFGPGRTLDTDPVVLAALGAGPFGSAVMASDQGPLLAFDDASRQWEVMPGPVNPTAAEAEVQAPVETLQSDGRGGFWMAAGRDDATDAPGTWFYRYTDRAPGPVFDDVSQPFDGPITALAGGADGSLWMGTDSDRLAHYDRLTGWQTVEIPGWDAARIVTRSSPVHAIAIGPDGKGLAVGAGGRIADVGATVELDRAAGAAGCGDPATAPVCGTGRDLRAAAVAPDGSALVGGDALSLLFRPPGGDFQSVTKPAAGLGARITGIALPAGDRAWLTLNTGQVFAGTRSGGGWSWHLENTDADTGDMLSKDIKGKALALRAVAVDASGHGLAVGDRGLVLERTGDGRAPWRRLDTGFADDLTSVALPAGAGAGALIGGAHGLVLTLTAGHFAVAQQPDAFAAAGKPVVGLALLPGVAGGQTEAWAALSDPASGAALLHYASDPDDPLLNPDRRSRALPDEPLPRPGEISLAALGKSDCHLTGSTPCDPLSGLALAHDVGARRTVEAITAVAKRPGGPRFAIFTGDVNDAAGSLQGAQVHTSGELSAPAPNVSGWAQLVAARLRASGVPVYGAFGAQDVTSDRRCVPNVGCLSQKQLGNQSVCQAGKCVAAAGNPQANLLWREALAGQPAPWGSGPPSRAGGWTFEPAPGSDGTASSPLGGARTHYAVDVADGDRKLARLVFVDNSQRSLAAGDGAQAPLEAGGQQTWLRQVLCTDGPGCTRAPGQRAIVVANTPSYSYDQGVGTGTATDATMFEATLMTNHADVVVSGRIGWNALYYAVAPGVHAPCPAGSYPSGPPEGTPNCGTEATSVADDAVKVATGLAADALRGVDAPPPPDPAGTLEDTGAQGLLPFVVASGAGGKLADTTGEGEWHGYSIVRLDASGDPRRTIVEQRPVFDWLNLTAKERVLHAGQHVKLAGVGREPLAIDEPAQLDRIDSPAITHRYDLLQADPARPYLPRLDADGRPVALDPSVATVDAQSGEVKAGRGRHERAYAIAQLSVGDLVATYPMVFEPSPVYQQPKPAVLVSHAASVRTTTPLPPTIVLGTTPAKLPTAPPPPAAPAAGNLAVAFPPAPAPPPVIPGAAPPTPNPPPPPPPPPPPAQVAPPAFAIGLKLQTISVPSTLPPPTPPPVNPAPPSGSAARKEAKQRQAATAKSESAAAREETAAQEESGQRNAFARYESRDAQPSAWVRGAVAGGGMTVAALVLALGWTATRPRRRDDARPALGRAQSR